MNKKENVLKSYVRKRFTWRVGEWVDDRSIVSYPYMTISIMSSNNEQENFLDEIPSRMIVC
jgi:hypothetical protein